MQRAGTQAGGGSRRKEHSTPRLFPRQMHRWACMIERTGTPVCWIEHAGGALALQRMECTDGDTCMIERTGLQVYRFALLCRIEHAGGALQRMECGSSVKVHRKHGMMHA